MTNLLLHPKTLDRVEAVISNTPQGLIITGETGSGKATIARALAAQILGIEEEKLSIYPYLHILDPAENVIKIEEIRNLQQFLKLKVPAENPGIRRVVIISRAERLRTEAQNALLKTLEEPPANTMLILTAESPERLLQTIVSRCQELAILPVSLTQAKDYFSTKGVQAAKLSSAYALSMGQAGLLNALLSDETHPLKEQVELAKSILSAPAGKRLYQIDAISKDKDNIRMLLNAFKRIAHAALAAASTQGREMSVKQWHKRQKATLEALEDLNYNANTKLLLTNLFLSL